MIDSSDHAGSIVFRRSGLAVGETYFHAPTAWELGRIDVLRIIAAPAAPSGGRPASHAHTLAIDLARDEDRIFGDISSDTRRKIRRALDKDAIETTMYPAPSAALVAEFSDAYDHFAHSRSLVPVFRPRLHALVATGGLLISAARSPDGRVLVWHAYVTAPKRGHLLYSASMLPDITESDERNMIGRANRLLHWHDILHAREQGFSVLDLGGIDVTGRSEETTRIAHFKRNFGGTPTPSHSWSESRSAKGALALFILRRRGSDF